MKICITKKLEATQSVYENYSITNQEQGLEVPLVTEEICKFKKSNMDIVANMLLSSRKGTYTAYRSNFDGKCSKQLNLLMVAHKKNRHYTKLKGN